MLPSSFGLLSESPGPFGAAAHYIATAPRTVAGILGWSSAARLRIIRKDSPVGYADRTSSTSMILGCASSSVTLPTTSACICCW